MKKRRSIGMLFTALMAIVAILTGSASAYDITGTVTYGGGTTSRVYITGDSPNGPVGTSIDSIGGAGLATFTIRGVPPGMYNLRAFIDKTGYGSRHASDPAGSSSPVNVNSGSVSGVSISLANPAPVAPQAPFEVMVSTGSGAAVVAWEGPRNQEDLEIADSYNIYWSKDPGVSPTNITGGGSFKGYPANDESHYVLTGLNNGDQYYFVVTAQLGNQESAPSPAFGPVTIGPLSGGATVSGTVSLSGTYSTGKLYIAVVDEKDNVYITCAQSPTFPQAYSVTGVPDGNYRIYAILDVNGDGVIGAGDIMPVDEQAPMISVSGSTVNGPTDVVIVQQDGRARVTTSHWKSNYEGNTNEGYGLNFDIRGGIKQPVRVTLNGGPGISGPVDMGLSEWGGGEFHTWRGVPNRPVTDDSYAFDVVYSDGTTGTLDAKVTGVLDSFATPLAPVGQIPSASPPTFTWSAPANPPAGPYGYSLWMSGNDFHWDTDRMPSSQLSAPFNFDGEASRQTLAEGANYYWSIAVVDGNGNRSENQGTSFTFGTPGSIQGRVTNPSGGGIYDVYVDAYDAVNGMYVDSTRSDLQGNYSISLPSGSYKIHFAAAGLNGWYQNAMNQDSATPVAVTAPNATTGINAVFDLAAPSISGRVTDSTGKGIQGVWVSAYDANSSYTYSNYPGASTQADGSYALSGLPAGSYKVRFEGGGAGFIGQWYNNKTDQAQADPVTVATGVTTSGINAVLSQGGAISGKVTNSAGAGIGGVFVSVNDANGNYIGMPGASTQTDGSYTIGGLPAGTYKIRFESYSQGYVGQWYNNKTSPQTADPVAVSLNVTTPGINAVLSKGGAISGKVTDSTGAGISGVWVNINDANGGYISMPGTMTQSDGSYTVSGLPAGSYKVSFEGGSTGYIGQWYNNKTSPQTADLVTVNLDATTSGINAVLSKGGAISGKVTNSAGAGIGGVWISLNDANGNYISMSGATTAPDGSYTLGGLQAGSYKVLFNGTSGYASQWYNNKPSAAEADLVTVADSATTSGINAVMGQGATDSTPPALFLSTLANGAVTGTATLNIAGTVSDDTGIQSLTINNYPLPVGYAGSFSEFSHALQLMPGTNTITTVATDYAGNKATDTRVITLAPTAQQLTVSAPADNSRAGGMYIDVTGSANETSTVEVMVNGYPVQPVIRNGASFSATVNLTTGINTIEITATDETGTKTSVKRTVTSDPGALSLAITDPAQDIATDQSSIVISGTVADAQTPVAITISVDGQSYTPQVTNGSFSQAISFTAERTYAVMVSAADETGKIVSARRNIIYRKTATAGSTIDLGTVGGSKGGTVTIPVTLTNAGGASVAALSVDISYDPNLLLNPIAAIGAAGSAAEKIISSSSPSAGLFRVGVLGMNTNSIGNGVVANVTFSIATTAEQGSITLYNIPSATDPAGNPVPVSGKNGAVNIISKAGDCDGNGMVSIAEVQSAINMFLGLKPVAGCVDLDASNGVSIAEVQKSINSFLGL